MNVSRSIQASLAASLIVLGAAGARGAAEPEEKTYVNPEIVVTASRIEWPLSP